MGRLRRNRSRVRWIRVLPLAIAAACLAPLLRPLWAWLTNAAADPDAYCADGTGTTAVEALWGWHRQAVRSGRVNGTCFDEPSGAARLAVVVSAYDEDLSWVERLSTLGLSSTTVYLHEGPTRTRSHHSVWEQGQGQEQVPGTIEEVDEEKEVEETVEHEQEGADAERLHGARLVRLPNLGDEALAVATFVAEHYEALPEWVAFVQGAEASSHLPMAMPERLRATCLAHDRHYLDLNGWPACHDPLFTTEGRLRCIRRAGLADAAAGSGGARGGGVSHGGGEASPSSPSSARRSWCASSARPGVDDCDVAYRRVARIWRRALAEPGGSVGGGVFARDGGAAAGFARVPPAALVSDCCAQFVVSRHAMRRRPRRWWRRLASWMRRPGADWAALEFCWRTIFDAPTSDYLPRHDLGEPPCE